MDVEFCHMFWLHQLICSYGFYFFFMLIWWTILIFKYWTSFIFLEYIWLYYIVLFIDCWIWFANILLISPLCSWGIFVGVFFFAWLWCSCNARLIPPQCSGRDWVELILFPPEIFYRTCHWKTTGPGVFFVGKLQL